MQIQISDHFTTPKLLRFALPSIVMMVFTSMYTIVDGLFVSNLVGQEAFTSLNLIWPAIGIFSAFGFMIGTGGTALVSKTLGEKREQRACEYFTMLIVFEILLGLLISVMTMVGIEPLARLCGATEDLIPDCIAYGLPLLACMAFSFLSASFQSFLVAAGQPKMGLMISLAAGVMNMVMDYVCIAIFGWGIFGAAFATGLNWVVGAVIPMVWFYKHQESPIHFTRFSWRFGALGKACFNGMSEMVSNVSMNLVALLYNLELMKIAGPDGVVVYGIIQYLTFLFIAAFLGYSMATAPCIGYQYGAQNHEELSSLLKKSIGIIAAASVAIVILSDALAPLLSSIFVSYSPTLMEMTQHAIRIYSLCFLAAGFNVFTSSFFTALNNGVVSAVVSLMRTFLFQVGAVLLLPIWFGLNGIWSATTVAEGLSLVMSIAFLVCLRKRYGY